jgi:hypothetical protein
LLRSHAAVHLDATANANIDEHSGLLETDTQSLYDLCPGIGQNTEEIYIPDIWQKKIFVGT